MEKEVYARLRKRFSQSGVAKDVYWDDIMINLVVLRKRADWGQVRKPSRHTNIISRISYGKSHNNNSHLCMCSCSDTIWAEFREQHIEQDTHTVRQLGTLRVTYTTHE